MLPDIASADNVSSQGVQRDAKTRFITDLWTLLKRTCARGGFES